MYMFARVRVDRGIVDATACDCVGVEPGHREERAMRVRHEQANCAVYVCVDVSVEGGAGVCLVWRSER